MTENDIHTEGHTESVTREDVQRLLDLGALLKSVLTKNELKEIEELFQISSWKNR